MAASMKVEGLKDLDRALAELPRATGKNVLRRALLKAGQPVADAAEALAPRDEGDLAVSITAGTKLSPRQKSQTRKQSTVEVYVGAGPLPQAHLSEFGTAHHGAQPFVRPAWDGNKRASLASLKGDLAEEIEKARARAAKKAEREAARIKSGL